MSEKGELKECLKRPPVPSTLESRIRHNWKIQRVSDERRSSVKFMAAAAGLFALVFALVLAEYGNISERLVSAAVKDIHRDAQSEIGITIPVHVLLKENALRPPPDTMPVKMTKYCTLNGSKSLHIKVAGEHRGEVHLFLGIDHTILEKKHSDDGVYETMPWKLIQPRQNLAVLVVYTPDMNPVNVEKLIQSMFYA